MRGRRLVSLGMIAGLLLLAVTTTRAEIGIVYQPGSLDQSALYILTIVDEPDPFGIWFRHTDIDDLRRRVLNPDGDDRGDGPPSIVYNAVWQVPLVVWSKYSAIAGQQRVVVSMFVDGAWQTAQPINVLDGEQLDPFVAVGTDGSLHVVFWRLLGQQHEVYHQMLPLRDGSWSAPALVSAPGEIACRPSAVIHQGQIRAVYELLADANGGGPRDVVLAELADGLILRTTLASSTHDGPLWPQIHSNGGKLWVDWIDFTNGAETNGEMAWTKLTQDGQWTAPQYEIFESEEQRDYFTHGEIRAEALGLTGGSTVP